MKIILLVVAFVSLSIGYEARGSDIRHIEKEGVEFLTELKHVLSLSANKLANAKWDYDSNITELNRKRHLALSKLNAKIKKEQWTKLIKFPWQEFSDPDLRRQFRISAVIGNAALSDEDFSKFEDIVNEMVTTYSRAKICSYQNRYRCDLAMEPDLVTLLKRSHEENELKHVWVEWRRASGERLRNHFKEYARLSNKAAVLNNFTNAAALWLRSYETPDFRNQLSTLWNQLKPLYQQLHAYVRRHLRTKYGDDVVTSRGPIPAHLLGSMWGQTWDNIKDFMMPYPNRRSTDVTPNMIKQGYTPLRMFKLSEECFTSLNLSAMPETFWEKSILEKPHDGREILCLASAWDFLDGKDFRIKLCTSVNQENFYLVHHEMGHTQYHLQYTHQPVVYRRGANNGFHEAVGDVIALSVSTPKHLRAIGLLEETNHKGDKAAEYETMINQLFTMALSKVAFLPFAYLIDIWRWDIFEGRTKPDQYNCDWWKLREQYQGLEPPEDRTEDDFDPASIFHTVAGIPYVRYFVSNIIQFQFHRALCEKAGQLEEGAPLHECDIYKSTAAGNLLGDVLKMGSSKPWPEAMDLMTGQPRMDAGALREYFAPLETWLRAENQRTGEFIGWEKSTKLCVQSREELSRLQRDQALGKKLTPTDPRVRWY